MLTRRIALYLVFVAILSYTTEVAYADSQLTYAQVNGQTLSTSNPIVTVSPGASLTGTINIDLKDPCSSCVLPSVGINSWNRNYYADLGGISGDNQWHTKQFSFSFVAPSSSGTYYIAVGYSGCYAAADVVYGCYGLGDSRRGQPGGGDDIWDTANWESMMPANQPSGAWRAIKVVVSVPPAPTYNFKLASISPDPVTLGSNIIITGTITPSPQSGVTTKVYYTKPDGSKVTTTPVHNQQDFSAGFTVDYYKPDTVDRWSVYAEAYANNQLIGTSNSMSFTVQGAGFSISTSPIQIGIYQGSSGTVTVSVSSSSQQPYAASLSLSGLPAGVYYSFIPSSGNPSFTSTLTLTVGQNAPTGDYTVTVTGAGGGYSASKSFTLTIYPITPTTGKAYFSSTPSGAEIWIDGSYTGFRTPNTINNLNADSHTFTLKLSGYNDYSGTFSVTSGQTTNVPTVTLIAISQPFDFSISVSPNSGSVNAGKALTNAGTVSLTLISGSTQPVTLSLSGLPSNVGTHDLEGLPSDTCSPPCSISFGIGTYSTAPSGTYTLTITGTGGGKTHSTTYTLTVQPSQLPDSASIISFNPPTGIKSPGDSLSTSIVIKNTGTTTRSYWVGLSFQKPDGTWYDVPPQQTNTLSPSGQQTLTFYYNLPSNAPSGRYNARTAVWNGYNPSTNLMVEPMYTQKDIASAFTYNVPPQILFKKTTSAKIILVNILADRWNRGDVIDFGIQVKNTGQNAGWVWPSLIFVGPGFAKDIYGNPLFVDPEQTSLINVPWKIPADAPAGAYTVSVYIYDEDPKITEAKLLDAQSHPFLFMVTGSSHVQIEGLKDKRLIGIHLEDTDLQKVKLILGKDWTTLDELSLILRASGLRGDVNDNEIGSTKISYPIFLPKNGDFDIVMLQFGGAVGRFYENDSLVTIANTARNEFVMTLLTSADDLIDIADTLRTKGVGAVAAKITLKLTVSVLDTFVGLVESVGKLGTIEQPFLDLDVPDAYQLHIPDPIVIQKSVYKSEKDVQITIKLTDSAGKPISGASAGYWVDISTHGMLTEIDDGMYTAKMKLPPLYTDIRVRVFKHGGIVGFTSYSPSEIETAKPPSTKSITDAIIDFFKGIFGW